jgi:pimeloyl-ACP methyl ester carboxylesterase
VKPAAVARDKLKLTAQRVAVRGREIPYWTIGSGPPLVLLHGLGGSSRCWRLALGGLATTHCLFLVDWPGFGSLRQLHREFALEEAWTWLADWLDAVALPRVHVVGHSMGGYIAARFAARYPHAVERLVLVAPAGIPTGRSLLRHVLALPRNSRQHRLRSLRLVASDVLRTRPGLAFRIARDLLAADVRPALGAILAPTLVAWGAKDLTLSPTGGDVFRRIVRDCQLILLADTGHLPMVDQPREFSAVVAAFLAGRRVGR